MTRKDYVAIAGAINEAAHDRWALTEPRDRSVYMDGVRQVTKEIARVLASDNPRFDAERFLREAFKDC